jgi:hypothetical protein
MSRFDEPAIRNMNPRMPVEWQEILARNLAREPASRSRSPQEFLEEVLALPTDHA